MARYCVGVTGGVASGKSTVTALFAALGVHVADADLAARAAVATGSPGLAEIVATFGTRVLDATGALDRAAVRAHVFNDPDARRQLEAIVHPRVRTQLRAECEAAAGPYAIAAIPLLAESGRHYPWLQRVVVVDAPRAVQLARLMQRDGIDAALAARMLDAQATRAQRLEIADDVIVNDGPAESLAAHVAALDRRFRLLAATSTDAG
jgi:dephospho-CoA kinase